VEEYEKWKKLRGDQPFRFTAKKIHGNPDYADPPDARNVDFSDRLRDAGPFQFDSYGRPINPLLPADASYVPEGRGVLGKWGPNTAEDKLVIGMSDAGSLQILLIERENPKDGWAIPGGMTERGEGQGATSTREFLEEAIDTEALTKQELATLTAYLDAQASLFYRGPMDDPRNTRNAWMFTRAYRVGAPPEIIKLMKLRPQKGEVRTVRWFDINDLDNVKA
jgi:ADP-ribose pyrophosphatase YjhB (NUDIX family)